MSEPKVEEEYSNNPESVGDSEYKYEQNEPILKVDHLSVSYPIYGGWFQRQIGEVKAVRDVSFEIRPGETLGLVGESGCG
ncbi:MAG: dipeptide/oligopeptide/nickel ABC transporter ATP-binding protein, partial [Promethearchaeota archaeon]